MATIDGLTPEQYLRMRAVDSLKYGDMHAGGDPALEGFGYFGLGLISGLTARQRNTVRAAMVELPGNFPDDAKVVRTSNGRRLLVRAFEAPGQVTRAFRLAREYADRAGV